MKRLERPQEFIPTQCLHEVEGVSVAGCGRRLF